MKKRLCIMILLMSVCVSAVSLSPSAQSEMIAEKAKFVTENNSFLETDSEAFNYYAYIDRYYEEDLAAEKVIVEVNGSIDHSPLVYNVDILADGLYTFGMSYRSVGSETTAFEIGLQIDNEIPFSEAEKLSFPRMWKDAEEGNRVDGLGNELAAKQVPLNSFYYNIASDITKVTNDAYLFFLTAGTHKITINPVNGNFELEYFELGLPENLSAYQLSEGGGKMYDGDPIVLEGEAPFLKSSFWLSAKTDNTNVMISPNSTTKSLVNYIGGSNWKTAGDTIVWKTPKLEEGYYQLGFSFRQSAINGGKVYRKLAIDGQVPFVEASKIGFEYDDNWQQGFFADENEDPYLIYIPAGEHEISLTVVPGDMKQVRELLSKAVTSLGSLYMEMTMITGETVDIYRDYDLFVQIPDMKERLESIHQMLLQADTNLKETTGQSSGSYSAVIKNMAQIIEQILNNPYTAHRYKREYYNQYTALASFLLEIQNMPLDLDKLVLTAAGQKNPFEKKGIFEQISFYIQRFLVSFFQDYNSISGENESSEEVTIWVNWGRDQAQVLNILAQTSLTADTGVTANVQLVNANIVQAVLSGKGPDCILQQSRSEPVNLAMRGVLYDLTEFSDLNDVLKRFEDGAEVPYQYRDGLYALPDTQLFYLMFYRKDILEQMSLELPNTWIEFQELCKQLSRQNLSVWLPNNPATDVGQVNAGIGSINLFPSLLMQKGLSIYSSNGKSSTLSTAEVATAFGEWTDYYRKLKLPLTLDFYNRFRTGSCPVGISVYTLYTTLKAAAMEIDGLWGVAPIPGTIREDGSIDRTSTGGGTACAILKSTKNPESAWTFLKWWTSAKTQLTYSNEVESILGPAGRVAVSNMEALESMTWDEEMLDSIMEARSQVKEVPEYPGSYYISRSVYQSFWNVVNNNKNPKDTLMKYSREADKEIKRKWKQYEDR